jgi:hypothetical protein
VKAEEERARLEKEVRRLSVQHFPSFRPSASAMPPCRRALPDATAGEDQSRLT